MSDNTITVVVPIEIYREMNDLHMLGRIQRFFKRNLGRQLNITVYPEDRVELDTDPDELIEIADEFRNLPKDNPDTDPDQ